MSHRPGYKNTEIGEIPEDWLVVRLGEITVRLENGLTYREDHGDGGMPITRIETISSERIDAQRVGLAAGLSADDVSRHKLEIGDILFSHINSIEHIGKSAIYQGNPPLLIHGMNLLLIRPVTDRVDPFFLMYYLKHGTTRNRLRSLAKKAVNQASINTTELKSFKLPLPPLSEQRKIVSILSTVDEAIQKTDEIITKTQRLKKGVVQQLLTKGIGHTEFKRTGIGEIPEEWEVVPLRSILSDDMKVVIDPGAYADEVFELYSIPAYYSGYEPEIRRGREIKSLKLLVHEGIVLFGKINPRVPKVWLVEHAEKNRKIASTEFIPLAAKPGIESKYLYYLAWSRFVLGRSTSLVVGTTPSRRRADEHALMALPVPLPSFPEQRKIASILSIVDDKIEKEKQRRQRLEQLRKGLMQALLTGKVRVKVS